MKTIELAIIEMAEKYTTGIKEPKNKHYLITALTNHIYRSIIILNAEKVGKKQVREVLENSFFN